MLYHDKHLCQNCGAKFSDHAGPKNPNCPVSRCPGYKFPSFPEISNKRTEAKFDEEIRAFWNERTTVFSPK